MWWGAAGLSAAFAAIVVCGVFGPRPDLAAAAETARFLFKLAVTITLAVSAFRLAQALSRPGESLRHVAPFLAVAPVLLAIAVTFELMLVPPETWSSGLLGRNGLSCLASILLVGIGPLALFLMVLRHGAPTRPAVAGAAAGLLAGAMAATFYVVHCTDDSPLFVATWYMIAVAGLTALGAAAGNRFARW
jgi:hypothetical protein